jgi:hypothetical protein
MSDILTAASLPGVSGAGLMDWGRLTRAEIIKRTRELAAYQKEQAEKVLAAADEDFDVRVVRGARVQHLIERL